MVDTRTSHPEITLVGATDANLSNEWWRLNNLYFIKNKQGEVIKFKPNWAQKALYEGMWFLCIILKARQLGMTTFIQIFILDRCLFNDNVNAGVIAHNKEDAEAFFQDKIKFAYDHLPEDLKRQRAAVSDSTRHLRFANGSQIRVGTSMRSGTYQYLHVSEFGKMCSKFPEKAREVITGSLNTVAAGQFIFIESTAEGPFGEFYDMCRKFEDLTMAVINGDIRLTDMDYKFFFFPWFKHPDYAMDEGCEIPEKMTIYFKELVDEHNIELTPEQKFWYVRKEAEQGQNMKQEYPSTPAEAFERMIEGAIYGRQMRKARHEHRIGRLPIERGVPVNTFWDLGRNDVNSIWFHQLVGSRNHFVLYYEYRLVDLTHYVHKLRDFKDEYEWHYGSHYLPFDVEVTDISSAHNQSRKQILQAAGLKPIVVVPKIKHLNNGIELTRRKFDTCYFDEERCEIGLRALAGYEYVYDDLHRTFRQTPQHNWASNGSDAFRQFAQGFRGNMATFKQQLFEAGGADDANPRQYMRDREARKREKSKGKYGHVL